jgi:hypothetical protein
MLSANVRRGPVGARTLEAIHLHGQNETLLKDRTLLQVTDITAVQPIAPAVAHWARRSTDRAAGLNRDRLAALVSADDALAHTGKNSVEPAEHLVHDEAKNRLHRPEIKAPRGSSHRLRKTLKYILCD